MQANRLVIITGLSGSGKSLALDVFEDMGYFCVDNLPAPLISQFVEFLINIPEGWGRVRADASGGEQKIVEWRFALQVDCRDETAFPVVSRAIDRLREIGTEVSLLFFDCFDDILAQRYRETRRPHPLLLAHTSLRSLSDAFSKERELLSEFRGTANRIIDTTSFSPHDLRRVVEGFFRHESKLDITVSSFGFKYGVPHDVDLLIDVRFLPNPHFVPGMREQTGLEESVQSFVFQSPDANEFFSRYMSLLDFVLPRYQQEGKRYLNIAVGCTGGRHRSVAIALRLTKELEGKGYRVSTRHRDVLPLEAKA